jgi:16S rRNA (guanine966-N2)-methyltransferase
LRVISGSARGRKLSTPSGMRVRPTADRVKEAIFNILASRMDLEEKRVLDLFAGTGNLGIEALSRGCTRCVFVDNHRESAAAVRQNLETCGFTDRSEIVVREAGAALKLLETRDEKFDLIFLDPPYGKGLAKDLLLLLGRSRIVSEGAMIVAEHAPDEEIPEAADGLSAIGNRRYGDTAVTVMTKEQV